MDATSVTLSPLTLPPPAFDPTPCAAGEDGSSGCRRCVESCPYLAIRPIPSPDGTLIHIDAGLCQRCGACTSICPTGALTRSFLPDDAIVAMIDETLRDAPEAPLLVFAGPEQAEVLDSYLAQPIAVVILPSLLILNENHLLHATGLGAAAIAIVGQPFSHHGVPSLLEDILDLARSLGSAPGVYIEGGDVHRVSGALDHLAAQVPDPRNSDRPGPISRTSPPAGPRRVELRSLLREGGRATEMVPSAAFGMVSIRADDCTLCGSCARICPTDALSVEEHRGELTFTPLECVGCGLCAGSCPEDVLTLELGLPQDVPLADRQLLVRDEVVPCVVCGEPHLPARLIRAVRSLLDRQSDLPPETSEIDRCPACRTIGVVDPTWDAVAATPGRVAPEPPGGTAGSRACGCGPQGCGGGGAPAPDVPDSHSPELGRRSFLKGLTTALSGFAALAGGAGARPVAAQQGGGTRRLGMVIDLDKCIGCHACTVACKAENDVPLGSFRDWVEEHLIGEYPTARPYFLPKLCNQCDDPGCLRVCPTGAIFRRDDGIVDLNSDICIGCRACNQGCPYGMTFMNPARGTADKCNFCAHRVDEGLEPACVDICPADCRIFGDLNDSESPISKYIENRQTQVLRRDLGLGPNVSYVSLPAELNR